MSSRRKPGATSGRGISVERVLRRVRTGDTGDLDARGRWVMADPFDVRLEDDELLREVELTANLIVAANQADGRLSPSEIDKILGVRRA